MKQCLSDNDLSGGHFPNDLIQTIEIYKRSERIADMGSWEWDVDTDTVRWSDGLFRIFQLDPSEGGCSLSYHASLYHPDDFQRLKNAAMEAINHGTPYEIELRAIRKDGETRYCIARGFAEKQADGKVSKLYGTLQDITTLMQSKSDLNESQKLLKAVVEGITDTLSVIDYYGNFLFVNSHAAKNLCGGRPEDVIGHNIHDFVSSDSADKLILDYQKVIDSNTQIEREIEVNLTDKPFWFINRLMPLSYGEGRKKSVLSISLDITERKRTAEALLQSELRLREAQQIAKIGSFHYESKNDQTWWSEELFRLYGLVYSNEPMSRAAVDSFLYPDDKDAGNQMIRRALETGKPVEVEYRIIRPDGVIRHHHAIARAKLDSYHQIFIIDGTIQDITDRKQAEYDRRQTEQQLIQTQRLESLGFLAGGIAHDFNNILGGIIGYADMSLDEVNDNSRLKHNLKKILTSADRAKNLVRQILFFSRQATEEAQPMYVQPVMKEVLQLLHASLPSTIDIQSCLQKDTLPIIGNSTRIHEIVMNLCVNASHAMAEKGVLVVKHEELSIEEGFQATIGKCSPGLYSLIEVKDSGCGIPAEIIPHIFEPYFTTKPVGEGTGLGLAVVSGVVLNYGGAIAVESELGRGTMFRIYLPKLCDEANMAKEGDVAVQGGTERLLFIDDESILCEIAEDMLGSLGYRIKTFTDSLRALQEFIKHPYDYDLIIADQTMPVISGTELAKEFLQIRPEVPIVLCTGFSKQVDEETAKKAGIRGYCMKPAGKAEVARKIREILDTNKVGEKNG